jgi:hypothetical protein
MKRLRIGIYPLSSDLTHPGDRRRIVSWARSRNHQLLIGESKKVDFVFISEGSDFLALSQLKGPPKVFDLIDGYLAPQLVTSDYLRGLLKSAFRQHLTYPRLYTSIVKEACSRMDMVICSSPEQRTTIKPYNSNLHVILDNHSEFPLLKFNHNSDARFSLFWEGTTHTLRGLEKLINALAPEHIPINIITDPTHHRLMGKYFKEDVLQRLNRKLGDIPFHFNSWSMENVVSNAKESSLAVLPLDLSNRLQVMKPENRLLIMFRLGLPCLTSNLVSYKRVENSILSKVTCDSYEDWSESIRRFRHDPDLMEQQVARGQRYLLENHTEEMLFSKWDQAFESLM